MKFDEDKVLIRKIDDDTGHENLDQSAGAMRKAFNLLSRAIQMKKRRKTEKQEVIRPNDKIEFNKLFDSQANDTKCGKSCQFSKKKVFEKKQNKELVKELKRHGIHTKSGKKSVLRTLLKSHYEEHGLDVSNLPS